MKKITVEVRDDHLELLSRAKPMGAVAELIWNAVDADATEVRVQFGVNDLEGIETITVQDNGHGLDYDDALVAFKNLGGSWKRDGGLTAARKRFLHGKYGKGRFRAFAIGNRVEWTSVFQNNGGRCRFHIVGRLDMPGEFEITDPDPAPDAPIGMSVEISGLPAAAGVLRGVKALQDATDLFALYMRQYPDVRIVYDGVPLDPANSEDRSIHYDLGEMVMQNGERIRPVLTVVEWNLPGKRGTILCDENGFALHPVSKRILFRGFSYTAYLKTAHFVGLNREGLLEVEEMTPDVKTLLEAARTRLRQHFALREAARAQDLLEQWRESGLYPYEGKPANKDEELERRIFDIYATHLNQLATFADAAHPNKRLILRMLQELIRSDPTRVLRVFDELIALPEDREDEIHELIET